MLEILLVFAVGAGPDNISDRVFYSYEECAEFVNILAGQPVVNSDYGFSFYGSDGVLIQGQCIGMKDWFLKKENTLL